MGKWKLVRQAFGKEEFNLEDGKTITIGRAINNTITLSSIVISRNHCVLNVQDHQVLITDLKSANGIYVGLKRIPPNIPYALEDADVVGIGWTIGAPLANINNAEKFVFKLVKDKDGQPMSSRIKFQGEIEIDDLEENISEIINGDKISTAIKPTSPQTKNSLIKRKLSDEVKTDNITGKKCRTVTDDEVINLLSDSDTEIAPVKTENAPKVKLEPIAEDKPAICTRDQIKLENDLEYDALSIKQEYLGYDDEPIEIDSDSDSESEHWFLRLSQSSPGKPFSKVPQKDDSRQEETSYSQLDDYVPNLSTMGDLDDEEEFIDDPIKILPPPEKFSDSEEFIDDIIRVDRRQPPASDEATVPEVSLDVVDGFPNNIIIPQKDKGTDNVVLEQNADTVKKIQLIEPQVHKHHGKSRSHEESKKTSSKHSRSKSHSSKRHISNSQKEERKKKLKEIASKEKDIDDDSSKNTSNCTSKSITNVKITTTNRGAFLTDVPVVKPTKKKDEMKSKRSDSTSSTKSSKNKDSSSLEDSENKKKHSKKHKHKDKSSTHVNKQLPTSKHLSKNTKSSQEKVEESRIPLKSLRPLTDSEETTCGKPFSKVEPLPAQKAKKKVRFSENEPEVHIFEIEPGNKLKKSSLAKMSLVDVRQMPVFSLEKITLIKILRWNPHWLEEQKNNNEPPPILGHHKPPMAVFHSFANLQQYVQLVGDLLLMEIWECLTLAYMKIKNQNGIPMRIESLPPVPTQERRYELFSLSVNISVPSNLVKNVPRVGNIILISFGSENPRTSRFFYVHNTDEAQVKLVDPETRIMCHKSLQEILNHGNTETLFNCAIEQDNIYSFFSVALHATFTEKMKSLHVGEEMVGKTLAFINKELNLFEAMEYLGGSPLSDAILRPETRYFQGNENPDLQMMSQWTKTLNPSQQAAVKASVSAALGDKPSIRMVQGPPGTGKSSVICSIVMTYFYDEKGRRQQNRGKILICATSNAAVDELVIRLLNIRQSLPKNERFRMVRVGRTEAMHARARDVSSWQLAQRDAARLNNDQHIPPHGIAHAGINEEIAHLEAKVNMWKTSAQDATDPVRIAYCQGRVNDLQRRITLVRSGGGGGVANTSEEMKPDQLIMTEKRIIEGADIVVTTLGSALNHKMKGLKRRIALCIVDEAGQAIEPETLIPLTLDVTRLTLIGDPQQLPGYICSQRAKLHGLGESLFSRLAACSTARESACLLLDQQYRMHADIADYPNRAFYAGRVKHVPPSRAQLPIPPYAILAIPSGDKGQGASGANEMEAWGVCRIVVTLSSILKSLGLSIAIITPYNAHKDLIKKHLKTLQDPNDTASGAGVEVNTVDSFQGQERDVVVVSLARSSGLGFLTDAGRMNVMLTRARHTLLICLNPHATLKNNQWRTLVEDAQKRHMYRVLPNKICQPSGEITETEVLRYINA